LAREGGGLEAGHRERLEERSIAAQLVGEGARKRHVVEEGVVAKGREPEHRLDVIHAHAAFVLQRHLPQERDAVEDAQMEKLAHVERPVFGGLWVADVDRLVDLLAIRDPHARHQRWHGQRR
jgi:hypothetical protein